MKEKKPQANTEENNNQPLPTLEAQGLKFHIKEDSSLWAEFEVQKTSRELSQEECSQLIEQSGYSPADYPIIQPNLALLLDAMKRQVAHYGCLSIPEAAKIDIFTSPNKLLAGAQVTGAKGVGQPLSQEAINLALKNAKISFGILDEVVKYLASEELHTQLRNSNQTYCSIIALGENLVNGQDAYLTPLVDDASDRRLKEDKYGNINYLERGDFPYIEEGAPLMRRVEPTKGKQGTSIQGKALRAKDGKDLQYKLKDASVIFSPQDPNLLIAATSGMPVIYSNGAQVEEVLSLQKVDVTTGHVRFKGSVEINEEVRDGMQVIATGDIKVKGSVDAAFLKAGGHIEITGGAIGHKGTNGLSMRAALKAQNSIKVNFCHEALLEAGQEIIIGSQATHSQVTAGTYIKIDGKGQAAGGKLVATDYIEVNVTGAFAYTETQFILGECEKLEEEYTQLLSGVNAIDAKKYRLIEVARAVRKKGKEEVNKMKPKLIAAKEAIQLEQKQLNLRLNQVEQELKRFYATKLIVHRRAYPGTLIHLANRKFEVTHEMGQVTFFLSNGKIATSF